MVKECVENNPKKQWIQAKGQALLKNSDAIDIIDNIERSLNDIAEKNDVDAEDLIPWFWGQMPIDFHADD